MTTIAQALTSLGVTEWVLRGEPTNEEEFNKMFLMFHFENLNLMLNETG